MNDAFQELIPKIPLGPEKAYFPSGAKGERHAGIP